MKNLATILKLLQYKYDFVLMYCFIYWFENVLILHLLTF